MSKDDVMLRRRPAYYCAKCGEPLYAYDEIVELEGNVYDTECAYEIINSRRRPIDERDADRIVSPVPEFAQVSIVRYNSMFHTEHLLKERIEKLERHIAEIDKYFNKRLSKLANNGDYLLVEKNELVDLLGLEGYGNEI